MSERRQVQNAAEKNKKPISTRPTGSEFDKRQQQIDSLAILQRTFGSSQSLPLDPDRDVARLGSLTPRDVLQLQRTIGNQAVGQLLAQMMQAQPPQQKENNTGLPNNLKIGVENLSGISMDDVKVHYNSSMPSQLQALAYTQGTSIYVGPGQERHLPHEAWHVVQQKQGRVQPRIQAQGVSINDDLTLEREADEMSLKAKEASTDLASAINGAWGRDQPTDVGRSREGQELIAPGLTPLGQPNGIEVTRTRASTVQRRLPDAPALKELLGTPMATAINLPKLKKAVRRMEGENRISAGTKIKVTTDLQFAGVGTLIPINIQNKTFDAAVNGNEEASWKIVINTIAKEEPGLLYNRPEEATTQIKPVDKQRLVDAATAARTLLADIANGNHDADIQQVFGIAEVPTAKLSYAYAKLWLETALFYNAFTTDYHGDDVEIFLGGYAIAGTKIHLSRAFFTDSLNNAIITLIHESAHLGNIPVTDLGYDGSPGYTIMSSVDKLRNADHYAEIARRRYNQSRYPNQIFTPATDTNKPTHYQEAARTASEIIRKAWTVGFRLLISMRNIYQYNNSGHPLHFLPPESNQLVPGFAYNEGNMFSWLEFWSSLTGLTFHKKTGNIRSLTTLDLALLEGVTRKLNFALQAIPIVSPTNESGLPLARKDELNKPYHVHLLTDHNIELAMTRGGGIRASIIRDVEMVKKMADYEAKEFNPVTFFSPTKLRK